MPWEEYPPTNQLPQRRGIQVGLPAADVLDSAGYPLDWFSKLKLGMARLFGGLEPVDKALPTEVHGVPTGGRERMQDLIDTLRPFASRLNFGRNPQDAEDLLDAFAKRNLGLGDIEQERASNLLKTYRRAVAKKNLEELGVFEVPEEPARGLAGVMQQMRQQGQAR
jgi:hypothetical protein